MLFGFLIVVIAIVALLLILLVLLQSGKGGGLAGIASGGATTQILGARQAPDVLEKGSWTLGALFLVLCVLSNFAIGNQEPTESVIQQRALEEGQTEQQAPVLPPLEEQTAPTLPPAGEGEQPTPAPEGGAGGDQ